MRILKLRLCNLNSLSGAWEIDFTHSDYINEGLFAITGATGAGKTTILDAICLALYGQTPRLGRITKSDNDIMSRQHGECWAEVCFATEQGEFRAKWYQHRARRAADGALQQAQHVLSEMNSGNILEESLSAVPLRVEALCGLNFDRFMRSMMLAQGQFAAFLNAKESERSELLEQLTGTDIYAQISKRVFARSKAEKDKLTNFKSRVGDIALLDDESLSKLAESLANKRTQISQLKVEQQHKQALAMWVEKLQRARAESQNLRQKQQQIEQAQVAFAPQRQRLEQDRKVRPYAADLKQLEYLNERQQRDEGRVQQLSRELEALRPRVEQALDQQQSAQQALQKQQSEWQAVQPDLEAARELNNKLAVAEQAHQNAGTEHASLQAQSEKLNAELTQLSATQKRHRENLNAADSWLAKHQDHAQLTTQVALLERDKTHVKRLNDKLAELKTQRDNLRGEYKRLAAMPQAEAQNKVVNEKTARLDALQETLTQQQQTVEHLKLQQRFESERHLLQEGEACPLCGSVEHPLTENAQAEATEITAQLQQAEDKLQTLQTQHQQVLADLQTLQLERAISASEQQRQLLEYQQRGEQFNAELQGLQAEQSSLLQAWQQQLKQYGIERSSLDELAPLEQLTQTDKYLREALQSYLNAQQQQQELAQQLRDTEHRIAHVGTQAEDLSAKLKQAAAQVVSTEQTLSQLSDRRSEYFNGRDTKIVEKENQQALESHTKAAQQAQLVYQELREQLLEKEGALRHLSEALVETSDALHACNTRLSKAATAMRLAGVEALAAGLLKDEEQQRLMQRAEALQREEQALQVAIQSNLQSIDEAVQQQPKDSEANQQRLDSIDTEVTELQQEIGALSEQQRQDTIARQRYQQITDEIAGQQKVCDNWTTLDGMIGSADGKKYRNFAQGLTLEIMIDYANEKLQRMTDRYLLVRDPEAPLALHVIDDYQGGENRSTRNLSGGESFIVSLALALGLAQMASSRVRVDSLFLDEGFGTLDPETLDVALDTLASLRQDGKMIGLISHVAALKERVATQLEVHAGAAGHSRLQGPGVRAIKQD